MYLTARKNSAPELQSVCKIVALCKQQEKLKSECLQDEITYPIGFYFYNCFTLMTNDSSQVYGDCEFETNDFEEI